jgi:hypothetical protein
MPSGLAQAHVFSGDRLMPTAAKKWIPPGVEGSLIMKRAKKKPHRGCGVHLKRNQKS